MKFFFFGSCRSWKSCTSIYKTDVLGKCHSQTVSISFLALNFSHNWCPTEKFTYVKKKTYGQIKGVIPELKQYWKSYVNSEQSNCIEFLLIAIFEKNSEMKNFNGIALFLVTEIYYPWWGKKPNIASEKSLFFAIKK